MSDYCYCDPDARPDTLTETVHKARIRHVCSECRGWIEPGEVYEKSWGVWDGEPDVFKTCPDCLALKDWTLAHIPCFCWTYGGLRAEVDLVIAQREAWRVSALTCQRSSAEFAANADSLRAEVEALRADAERWRYINTRNNVWRRHNTAGEEHSALCVILPYGADLSCRATREIAIDAARAAQGGE